MRQTRLGFFFSIFLTLSAAFILLFLKSNFSISPRSASPNRSIYQFTSTYLSIDREVRLYGEFQRIFCRSILYELLERGVEVVKEMDTPSNREESYIGAKRGRATVVLALRSASLLEGEPDRATIKGWNAPHLHDFLFSMERSSSYYV